jgi:iron(III) transport system ATP-binding protein
MPTSIQLENLSKTFVRRSGEEVRAIDDVSLTVEPGEFLVLLGPSGCGKTTLLRSLAGLEVPTSGRIVVNGRPLFDSAKRINVPPEQREMGMIFQSYALWPHMTVFDNVAYPLRSRGVPKKQVPADVERALALVSILELATQFPGQISGGQQQRVALARALVAQTGIVLFDEPLSNVDAKVREQLRVELKRMHTELGFTGVYVTHDQEEAMALATRIAVLHRGRCEQLAPPADVYRRPSTLVVARFIGTLNELDGEVTEVQDDHFVVRCAIGEIATRRADGLTVGDAVTVGMRPEDVQIVNGDAAAGQSNLWQGETEFATFLGPRNEYLIRVGGVELRATARSGSRVGAGETVRFHIEPQDVHVFGRTAPVGAA